MLDDRVEGRYHHHNRRRHRQQPPTTTLAMAPAACATRSPSPQTPPNARQTKEKQPGQHATHIGEFTRGALEQDRVALGGYNLDDTQSTSCTYVVW